MEEQRWPGLNGRRRRRGGQPQQAAFVPCGAGTGGESLSVPECSASGPFGTWSVQSPLLSALRLSECICTLFILAGKTDL